MKSKLDILKERYDRKNKVLTKKKVEYDKYSLEVTRIKNLIDFVENSQAVKPQILYYQGRDGMKLAQLKMIKFMKLSPH